MVINVESIVFGCKYVLLYLVESYFVLIINILLVVVFKVELDFIVYNVLKVVVVLLMKLIVIDCVWCEIDVCCNLIYLVFICMGIVELLF